MTECYDINPLHISWAVFMPLRLGKTDFCEQKKMAETFEIYLQGVEQGKRADPNIH